MTKQEMPIYHRKGGCCGTYSKDVKQINCPKCIASINEEICQSEPSQPQLSELQVKWLSWMPSGIEGFETFSVGSWENVGVIEERHFKISRPKQPVWEVGDFLIDGGELWRVSEVNSTNSFPIEAINGCGEYRYFRLESYEPITQEQLLELAAKRAKEVE